MRLQPRGPHVVAAAPVQPPGAASGQRAHNSVRVGAIDLRARVRRPADVELGQLYDLVFALQSTLDLPRLLSIFAWQTRTVVPCDGIEYRNHSLDLRLLDGQERLHHCGYQLSHSSEPLGELRFSRRKAFSKTEIKRLEVLLSAFVYPLRNALLYRSAREETIRSEINRLGTISVKLGVSEESPPTMLSDQTAEMQLKLKEPLGSRRIRMAFELIEGHRMITFAQEVD